MAAALPLSRSRPEPDHVARIGLPRPSFGVVMGAILAALSLVPYALAYLLTPPGHHFAGFFFIADDATTYLAKMQQGADGAWLWTDPYTSEPHQGVFLFGFYLLFGHLSALLHIPMIAGYHLAGVSGALCLGLAVGRLAERTLPPNIRRLAVVLALLGSGLGFLSQLGGHVTIASQPLEALDLHLPELSGWYSILAIPHFAWAAALVVLALLGLLNIADHPRPVPVIRAGTLLLSLAVIHPQMVVMVAVVWSAYRVLLIAWGERPRLMSLLAEAAAFLIAAPLFAYDALVLFKDPTVSEWASQWRHQAPNLPSLLLALGLPLLAGCLGSYVAWRRRDRRLAPLLVWPPVVILLVYLPNVVNIQRRLIDAVYVPVGLLAAVGLEHFLARFPVAHARRLRRMLVPLFCLSSALVMAIALRFASGAFPEAYIAQDQWTALTWLSDHHRPGDRVLSSPGIGLFIPAWSATPVYVGHYSETLDYFQKIRIVSQLLRPSTSPDSIRSFFSANGITLLYWGPGEQDALDFDPDRQPYLQPVYRDGSVTIYRVLALP